MTDNVKTPGEEMPGKTVAETTKAAKGAKGAKKSLAKKKPSAKRQVTVMAAAIKEEINQDLGKGEAMLPNLMAETSKVSLAVLNKRIAVHGQVPRENGQRSSGLKGIPIQINQRLGKIFGKPTGELDAMEHSLRNIALLGVDGLLKTADDGRVDRDITNKRIWMLLDAVGDFYLEMRRIQEPVH